MSDRFHGIHGSVMVITIIVPKRHDYLDDKALLFSFFFLLLLPPYVRYMCQKREKERISFFFLFSCTIYLSLLVSGGKKRRKCV